MTSVEKKILRIKEMFSPSFSNEERYHRIIALGKELCPYPDTLKISSLQVQGCQSLLYLAASETDGKIFFTATSDALISAGLAALLINVYSGETPETILKTSPSFLAELGLIASLTPSRSNGLAHIHRRMQQDAIKSLVRNPSIV